MRIKIIYSKNTKPVPIRNYSLLNSYIHKCLGTNNRWHDRSGMYNISDMQGGFTINADYLNFDNGGYLIVSAYKEDMQLLEDLITGIEGNPNFGFGMKYERTEFINEQLNDGWNNFLTISPLLFKAEEKGKYVTLLDNNFVEYITLKIKNKLSKIDPSLNLDNFKVEVPPILPHKKKKMVKLIMVNNVPNHASHCPISIFAPKRAIEILYNIGVGQSTNSGFGCIVKAENFRQYRPLKNRIKKMDTSRHFETVL